MAPEGYDAEVMSRRMLDFIDHHATEPEDREHVTSIIPKLLATRELPKEFTIHNSTEPIDLSHNKTSIDTQADYERATRDFKKREGKCESTQRYGKIF